MSAELLAETLDELSTGEQQMIEQIIVPKEAWDAIHADLAEARSNPAAAQATLAALAAKLAAAEAESADYDHTAAYGVAGQLVAKPMGCSAASSGSTGPRQSGHRLPMLCANWGTQVGGDAAGLGRRGDLRRQRSQLPPGRALSRGARTQERGGR